MAATEGTLLSRRPYLLRAMHEWITDNLQTPHLVVDATFQGVSVPQQFVQNGKIILNVSHAATNGLLLGNEVVCFRARFGGVTHDVSIPVTGVLGIYARETGQGMVFSENDAPTMPPGPPVGPVSTPSPSETPTPKPKRNHLKVVK